MDATTRAKTKAALGDFQTPLVLARAVAGRVKSSGFVPASIVEPSCGFGNMLLAAMDAFPAFQRALAVEIQPRYAEQLRARMERRGDRSRVTIETTSFFDHDWHQASGRLPDPILVIGNPPWVTNAALSSMGSTNLPKKSNFQGHSGLDALTGKSNFDISEAMLLKILSWLADRDAMLAMLCKTAVARKVLAYAWRHGLAIGAPSIRRIDSADSFDAAVDACVFECRLGRGAGRGTCPVYSTLQGRSPTQTIAFRDGRILADALAFDRWRHLEGQEVYRWRSGIKHDCADVVELFSDGVGFRTKVGETVEIERDFLYPMMKASDLGNGKRHAPDRWMLVTQRSVGEDTRPIATMAPKTWAYLMRNAERFERRGSVIYRGRPPFSMFGVGKYSFALWKVAIAGFYKKLDFKVIGPYAGKPVVVDDTCYFVGCDSPEEAAFIASLFNSDAAREFYSAFAFWDAKRPVTIELLRRLDVRRLASALGESPRFQRLCATGTQKPQLTGSQFLWEE